MNGIPLGIMASGHKFTDVTYSFGSVNTSVSQNDIAAQTVTLPSNADNSDTNPIVVIGVKTNRDDISAEEATFVNQSNFTRTDYKASATSQDAGRVGIFIGNNGRGVSNATTFTVDTIDEGFAQTLSSFFIKATGASTISLVHLRVKNGTQTFIQAEGDDGAGNEFTVVSGEIQVGDVAVLVDYAFNNTSTSMPTKVIPTGFTEISDAPFDTGNEFRVVCSFRTITASNIASGGTNVVGMNAEAETKWLYIFRGA